MDSNALYEERSRLEKFSFPADKDGKAQVPEYLRNPGTEPSVSRHRKLEKADSQFSPVLFQELSNYKMLPRRSHHRSHHQNSKSNSPRRRKNDVRNSVSPLRNWRQGRTIASSESQSNYVYQSPRETIRNFNEQIEMNANGRYESLVDYANDNKLDVRGKVFADSEEPKIDLEEGLEEALRATSIR